MPCLKRCIQCLIIICRYICSTEEAPARKVLQQFKFLDTAKHASKIREALWQVIEVVDDGIKAIVIASIPEIIDDSEQGVVFDELAGLLESNTNLTLPIIDAMSNLNATSESVVCCGMFGNTCKANGCGKNDIQFGFSCGRKCASHYQVYSALVRR